MALSLTQNITEEIKNNGYYVCDTSGWDFLLINTKATNIINFDSSNDSGEITGVTDGNSLSSTSYLGTAYLTNITGRGTQNTTTGTSMLRAHLQGRFIKITGSLETNDYIIVQYHKYS
jgi:hypothetical protein